MKKVTNYISVFMILALSVIGIKYQSTKDYMSPQALRNVQALAQDEGGAGGGWDCSYKREEDMCSIYVGAKGKIELFGLGVFTAAADGYVYIKAKVVCSSGGDKTCTPFECFQLWQMIVNNERG